MCGQIRHIGWKEHAPNCPTMSMNNPNVLIVVHQVLHRMIHTYSANHATIAARNAYRMEQPVLLVITPPTGS